MSIFFFVVLFFNIHFDIVEPSYFQSLKNLAASMAGNERGEYFTPSMVFNPHTPPIAGASIAATYVAQPVSCARFFFNKRSPFQLLVGRVK